jgi:hypothetical protein
MKEIAKIQHLYFRATFGISPEEMTFLKNKNIKRQMAQRKNDAFLA